MPLGILFWVLLIVWLIFGFWQGRTAEGWNYPLLGGSLIVLILLAILGWHAFGAPVR